MKKQSGIYKSLPSFRLPGQRIIRSVIAVWFCALIYFLRGEAGEPFYSIIAALQCIQPYSSNMLREGRDRIIGTLIGAFWGAVIVCEGILPSTDNPVNTVLYYILLGVFTGLVIYSTVLLNIAQYALFSAVVFLGIAMYHLEDVNPYIHVFNRTADTIIGVGAAILVNSLHFPRIRNTSTLFISGIDHVLFREDRKLTRYTTVELNRFLDEGIRFTVSTRQTPATVRELLSEIHLKLPIIAMDGAVLYNLNTMKYLRTVKMSPDLVTKVTGFLNDEGIPFFTNCIQDNLLVIYFKDYKDLILEEVKDAFHGTSPHAHLPDPGFSKSAYLSMAALYHKKRVSPYRNYVRTDNPITDDVVYILVIDHAEKIDLLGEKIMAQPWASQCRINYDFFDCQPGEKLLRIYTSSATRESMRQYLQHYVGAPDVVTFGNEPDFVDVLIKDASHDSLVKALKKRFEPISLKGVKNIFHL